MQNFHFHLSGISSDQDLLHTPQPLLFGWPPQKQAPMFRIYVVNHHSQEAVAKKLGQNFEKILEKKNTIETLKIYFFQEGIPLNQWNIKYSYKLSNDMFFNGLLKTLRCKMFVPYVTGRFHEFLESTINGKMKLFAISDSQHQEPLYKGSHFSSEIT